MVQDPDSQRVLLRDLSTPDERLFELDARGRIVHVRTGSHGQPVGGHPAGRPVMHRYWYRTDSGLPAGAGNGMVDGRCGRPCWNWAMMAAWPTAKQFTTTRTAGCGGSSATTCTRTSELPTPAFENGLAMERIARDPAARIGKRFPVRVRILASGAPLRDQR